MKPDDRLAIALWEADRHVAALSDALAEWAARPALDMVQLERDRLLLRLVDQILFRFTKLQDALGRRQRCSGDRRRICAREARGVITDSGGVTA